jgi:MoxR-like ATPase
MTTTTVTSQLHARFDAIFNPKTGFLARNNVERTEEIELLAIAIISGIDLLFLGDPGVGKTWLIELLTDYCIDAAELFTHLLAKDQSVSELLGEKDVMAMKEGRTARITAGSLIEANLAYLDEIFKGSPPMLNPLLDIFAKRQLKIGGKVIDCSQLITILMSSNELPDREDLQAFRDRIAITKVVQPVQTPEGRKSVSLIQLGYDVDGIDSTDLEPLTLDDIKTIRDAARAIPVPEPVLEKMGELEQKCLEAGFMVSQRRKRDIWRAMRSRAWLRGRDTVVMDDFLVAEHMAWSLPDHHKPARDIVTDLASKFTRKARRLREAMEAVRAEMAKLEQDAAKLDEAERRDKMGEGWQFATQLKKLLDEGKDQITEGEAEGEDVSVTREVVAEIKSYHKWVVGYLSGTDDDDDDE